MCFIRWGIPQIKKSSLFGFKEILYTATEHIGTQELKSWIHIPRKKNLFEIDLGKLEFKLRQHPWVDKARVFRVLPNQIRVEVEEKKPVAVLLVSDILYFLDGQGNRISRLRETDAANFAVISGLRLPQIQEKMRILEAYEILKYYEKQAFLKVWRLSEVHWDNVNGFVIFTSNPTFEIRMGKDDFQKRFSRLEEVLKDLSQKSLVPKLIDLNFSKKVVVKIAK